MRHLAEGRASSLTPILVYAAILEFCTARKSGLANFGPPFGKKIMQHLNTQRRAIGLLVIFATVLTLIASWNLTETRGGESSC